MTAPRNNTEKLVDVFSQQIQRVETVLFQVLIETRLANAAGVQLDTSGAIVGRRRADESDDRYRDLIAAQIALNLASGTIPEILAVISLVIGQDVALEFKEYFPAAFELEAMAGPLPTGQGATVAGVVKQAKAGGVKGLFQYFETSPVFALDGAGGSQFDGGYFFCTSI